VYELADVIKKKISFVCFGSIFFNLLIFQKYTRRVKNHVLFSRVPYFQCIHSIGPRWTPLSVELNASTFIIKNRLIWYCSYWAAVDNIFHHGRFLSCCVERMWRKDKNVNNRQIGKGIPLRSIFLRRFYRPTVPQRKIFSLFCIVHNRNVISQMIGHRQSVNKLKRNSKTFWIF